MPETLYEEHGCKNRDEYIRDLANENDVDAGVAFAMADLLGENEDFDGLVTTIEDIGLGYF